MKLIYKKSQGREAANRRFYISFHQTFEWFLQSGRKSRVRATACFFVLSEMLDNLYEHDNSFVAATIEINLEDETGLTSIKFRHDGTGYNPLAEDSKCIKIKENFGKLGCEATVLEALRGSAGTEMIFKFKFELDLEDSLAPYVIESEKNKDYISIIIKGDLVRGWGLETDLRFQTLVADAKKQATSNVIIFDLRNLNFWDTMGCSSILDVIIEINQKHKLRAKIWANKELIEFASHYKEEIDSGLITWVTPEQQPI